MSPRYDYPRPMASGDNCLFTFDGKALKVLLIQRGKAPYKGMWALPGGFIELDETLLETSRRELEEETGLTGVDLRFLGVYGDPGRDPRGRVITTVHWGIVPFDQASVRAGDDAAKAQWHPAYRPPRLAFDHGLALKDGLALLRRETLASDGAFRFLPARFERDALRRVFEKVLRKKIEAARFDRAMAASGLLKSAPGGLSRLCRKTLKKRVRESEERRAIVDF